MDLQISMVTENSNEKCSEEQECQESKDFSSWEEKTEKQYAEMAYKYSDFFSY